MVVHEADRVPEIDDLDLGAGGVQRENKKFGIMSILSYYYSWCSHHYFCFCFSCRPGKKFSQSSSSLTSSVSRSSNIS